MTLLRSINISAKHLICVVFLCVGMSVYAQNVTRISLTRRVYPICSYVKQFRQACENDTSREQTGLWRPPKAYNILAGDYSAGGVKFSIAVDLATQDRGRIYLLPYKADSVFTGLSEAIIRYDKIGKTCIMAIGGKEFDIKYDSAGKAIILQPHEGKYQKPDIAPIDANLPDVSISTMNGEKIALSSFKNKNRLIYIMIWDMSLTSKTEISFLKDISDKYKNELTIISVCIDSVESEKAFEEHRSNWVYTNALEFPLDKFQFQPLTCGILYDELGNIINKGVLPSELQIFLKKKFNK